MNFANSSLTVLSVFSDFFFFMRLQARNMLVAHFLAFTEFEFPALFPHLSPLNYNHSWFLPYGLKSLCSFFPMRLRAGNKSVYPRFTTFTTFEFPPLFPPTPIMSFSNSFVTTLRVFDGFFSCVSELETGQYSFNFQFYEIRISRPALVSEIL